MSHRYVKRKVAPYKQSRFVGDCGIIIPLPRMNRQREAGHIKDLWCPRCGVVHGFKEVRSWENVCTLADVWREE